MENKTCKRCGKSYPMTNEFFSKKRNNKCGLNSMCKNCEKEYMKEYRKNNADRFRRASRKYEAKKRGRLEETEESDFFVNRINYLIEKSKHEDYDLDLSLETKTCNKCGVKYPLTEEFFYKDKRVKCGFKSQCKNCMRKDSKVYRKEHREEIKVKAKIYRDKEENKIKAKEYHREYQKNHKEEHKEYQRRYIERKNI